MVKSEHKIQSKQMSSSSSSLSPQSPPSPNSYKKKFKGVRMRSWGSWVSEIRAPNQKTRIWLGSYSTPEAAARAYDAALICLKGSSANLNFPTNPTSFHIPTDTILSPKSIQRVAAAAAANAPPPSSPSLTSSDQIHDNIQIDQNSYYNYPSDHYPSMANPILNDEHWYDFDSPKYADPLMSSMFFNPPSVMMDDQLYEDGDIPLWSFC